MPAKPYKLPRDYLQVPKKVNITNLVLDRHVAAGRGANPAIFHEDQVITYVELQKRVNQFGNALKKLGLGKGDRFVVRCHNCPEFIIATLGGMKIGAVPLPTNTLFRSRELEHIINNSEAKLVLTMQDLLGPIDEVRSRCPTLKHLILVDRAGKGQLLLSELMKGASTQLNAADTSADDLAFMIYTSGTTGVPKGVQHAHRWIISLGHPIAYVIQQLTPKDITFFPRELSFIYAFGCSFLFPFHAGAADSARRSAWNTSRNSRSPNSLRCPPSTGCCSTSRGSRRNSNSPR